MSFNAGRQKPNGSEDSTCPLDGLEQSDDCTPALNSENCPALEKGWILNLSLCPAVPCPPEIVVEAFDVVFPEHGAALDFHQQQIARSGGGAVQGPLGNEDARSRGGRDAVPVDLQDSLASHDNPVLGSVPMLLQADPGTAADQQALHQKAIPIAIAIPIPQVFKPAPGTLDPLRGWA